MHFPVTKILFGQISDEPKVAWCGHTEVTSCFKFGPNTYLLNFTLFWRKTLSWANWFGEFLFENQATTPFVSRYFFSCIAATMGNFMAACRRLDSDFFPNCLIGHTFEVVPLLLIFLLALLGLTFELVKFELLFD